MLEAKRTPEAFIWRKPGRPGGRLGLAVQAAKYGKPDHYTHTRKAKYKTPERRAPSGFCTPFAPSFNRVIHRVLHGIYWLAMTFPQASVLCTTSLLVVS